MKIFNNYIYQLIIALSLFSFITINGQRIVKSHPSINIQPEPKEIKSLDKTIVGKIGAKIIIDINNHDEKQASDYFEKIMTEKFDGNSFAIVRNDNEKNLIRILLKQLDKNEQISNQFYEIKCNADEKEIAIQYKTQIGLIYAFISLSEYFTKDDDELKVNLFDIKDYPDFSRRIFSANPKPDEVNELLDFGLKNKIETIAIASRQYPWFQPSEEYKNLFEKIKTWKEKYGAPSIMQMHNIYDERAIEISNNSDVNALKNVLQIGMENGADKIMILADDTPPFEYGEGYVLKSENDKKKFKHMAEAHCYLLDDIKKWMQKNSFESELYYVPPFYTYEDMHYGEMELYKNTPWEDDAFKPLYRDLSYIGLNVPKDVYIIWTGPYVRSRRITVEDINGWTYNLKGVIPFLWDNTIYSHNAFISTPLFSAWDNNFPIDFSSRTGGNGMFINGSANSEDSKVSVITVNDYMWNTQKYSPNKSLNKAMNNLYGNESTKIIFQLKEVELELRKTIGERELRFESDSLWKIIRKVRYTHTKNPFYYHYNYSRMKALRLQLKGSVPEITNKNVFMMQCSKLYEKRNTLVHMLEERKPDVAKNIKKILIELPDFKTIN